MANDQQDNSAETLQQIRYMMERSTRFLSLSGWSGIWAGVVALAGASIAWFKLIHHSGPGLSYDHANVPMQLNQLLVLATLTFVVALAGAVYFTFRKNERSGILIWNQASRRMLLNLSIPVAAGGILIVSFLMHGDWHYVAPACLIFYGLALINSSKYTVSDIRYLGLMEVLLGGISLIMAPAYGLYIWAMGFGVLHIAYGIIMWRKYDRQ